MEALDAVKKEYQELLNQLSDPELISDPEKFEELTRKKEPIEKILEKEQLIETLKAQIDENKNIIRSQEEPELTSLAESEIGQLQEKIISIQAEIKESLAASKTRESRAVIMEIRAGTGGDEAAIFAADLFRMYSKYAEKQGWQAKVLDSHETSLGGFKEIIFEIRGGDVWGEMRNEAGVHRVQRIPATEKSGRVHTSTASVAVLLKPKKTELKIRPEELKIDLFRSSGPGGQNVNKRETAVRITHLPSGLSVASQTERNQLENRENAMGILQARLLERMQEESSQAVSGERRGQIGSAKRAEKIRTYNFSQDRLTDHRIKKSWHNLEKIMAGGLEPIIETLNSTAVPGL